MDPRQRRARSQLRRHLQPDRGTRHIVLSGGGTSPLITLSQTGTAISINWTAALPAPTVAGNTATYPEVMPGVDLQLAVSPAGGVSEVLIVKTAAAASDPGLASISFPFTAQGLTLQANPDSSLTATDAAGAVTYTAPTPLMWDSTTSAATLPAQVAPDSSAPGISSNQAAVSATVNSGTIVVTPTSSFLSASTTTFPVYIDPNWLPAPTTKPAFDQVKSGTGPPSDPICASTSEYNNASPIDDSGQLGVGDMGWPNNNGQYLCIGVDRAYYQFTIPSVTWGTDINGATINTQEVYTSSCSSTLTPTSDPRSIVYLNQTSAINAGTDWNNQPGPGTVLAQANVGTACATNPSVPFNVTIAYTNLANAHSNTMTVDLTGDENSGDPVARNFFKRFSNTPTLSVQYYPFVNPPGNQKLFEGNTTSAPTVVCQTSPTSPPLVANGDVTLTAEVSSPAGRSGVLLHTTFTLKDYTAGSQVTSGIIPVSSGLTAGFLVSATSHPWTNGHVYDWTLSVTDGITPPKTGSTCYFQVETGDTTGPTVTSINGVYPPSSSAATGAPARTPGQFQFCTTDSKVVYYTYGLGTPGQLRVNAPPSAPAPPSPLLRRQLARTSCMSPTPTKPTTPQNKSPTSSTSTCRNSLMAPTVTFPATSTATAPRTS